MSLDCHPKYIRMGCQREGGVRKGGGGEDGVCMQGKKVKVGWGARLWMEYSIFGWRISIKLSKGCIQSGLRVVVRWYL